MSTSSSSSSTSAAGGGEANKPIWWWDGMARRAGVRFLEARGEARLLISGISQGQSPAMLAPAITALERGLLDPLTPSNPIAWVTDDRPGASHAVKYLPDGTVVAGRSYEGTPEDGLRFLQQSAAERRLLTMVMPSALNGGSVASDQNARLQVRAAATEAAALATYAPREEVRILDALYQVDTFSVQHGYMLDRERRVSSPMPTSPGAVADYLESWSRVWSTEAEIGRQLGLSRAARTTS